MKSAPVSNTESAIRILKIASCPSLSEASSLKYHIGCTAKSEIQVRIYANTGNGFFNNDWVAFSAIQQALDKLPTNKPVNSFALSAIFRGRSANSPSFLLAALKHAGLVQPSKDKRRNYERMDPRAFVSEVKALMASKVELKETDKPQKTVDKKLPQTLPKKTPNKSTSKKKG